MATIALGVFLGLLLFDGFAAAIALLSRWRAMRRDEALVDRYRHSRPKSL